MTRAWAFGWILLAMAMAMAMATETGATGLSKGDPLPATGTPPVAPVLASTAPDAGATSTRPATQCPEERRYVAVTSAALRDRPDAASPARAMLPIGTEVAFGCVENGWARAWAPGFAGMVGSIRVDLLATRRPTLALLEKEFAALPEADAAGRRTIAERAVALAPTQDSTFAMLIDALRRGGDEAALRAATRRRDELLHPRVVQVPGEPRLILAMSDGTISPLASIGPGGLSEWKDAAGSPRTKGLPADVPSYFRPGRVLYHYAGGRADGMVRVLGKIEPTCDSQIAAVEAVPPREDRSGLSGVATNFPLGRLQAEATPAPDVREKKQLDAFLRKAMARKGLSRSAIERAMAPGPGAEPGSGPEYASARTGVRGSRMLVATVRADLPSSGQDGEETVSVVLIAEPSRDGLAVSYASVEKNGGDMASSRTFLDYMDLDGDGESELLFIGLGYESVWYEAWSKRRGHWKVVASGGGGGC